MKNFLHKLLNMPTFTESTRLTLLFSFHRMLLFSLPCSLPYREPRWCEDNIDFVRSFKKKKHVFRIWKALKCLLISKLPIEILRNSSCDLDSLPQLLSLENSIDLSQSHLCCCKSLFSDCKVSHETLFGNGATLHCTGWDLLCCFWEEKKIHVKILTQAERSNR